MLSNNEDSFKAKSGRATIGDIAREAMVSKGTVSRALNNSDKIKPETRHRILELSRRLGIRPIAPSKRYHFAVIVPVLDRSKSYIPVDPFVLQLLNELSLDGSALSAFTGDRIDQLQRRIYDGIFNVNWTPSVSEALESIGDTPVVVLNRFQDPGRCSVVGWDHVAEGRLVGEYFLKRGHKRLAFLGGFPVNVGANRLRLSGMQEVAAAAGFPISEEFVEILEEGSPFYAALNRLVGLGADAIFVPGHGRFAVEVINILQNVMNLSVPKDISIIGADSPEWSLLTDPPLTGVSVPYYLVAKKAVEVMQELILNKGPGQSVERLVEVSLVERKSVRNRSVQ